MKRIFWKIWTPNTSKIGSHTKHLKFNQYIFTFNLLIYLFISFKFQL
jgi:hypothetical protein